MERSNHPSRWSRAAAVALALGLSSATARAQAPGDHVRIETGLGVAEGTLVDRLPEGYLIRDGAGTRVVPYSFVKSIAVVPEAAATPPLPPAVLPGAVTPVGPLATPPPPQRNHALATGGRALAVVGVVGAGAALAVLVVGLNSKSHNTCHAGDVTLQCDYGPGNQLVTGGAIGISFGGAAIIAGAVMIAIGSAPAKQAAVPSVGAAPGGLALAWKF
jgi:hypothetical protein